jgi:hypothetical protein
MWSKLLCIIFITIKPNIDFVKEKHVFLLLNLLISNEYGHLWLPYTCFHRKFFFMILRGMLFQTSCTICHIFSSDVLTDLFSFESMKSHIASIGLRSGLCGGQTILRTSPRTIYKHLELEVNLWTLKQVVFKRQLVNIACFSSEIFLTSGQRELISFGVE